MSTILVVDDNPAMRDTIRGWLSASGLQVEESGSSDEALAWLARRAADAVVTDLRMPGMDGFQLLEALRQSDPGLPVLVMTAQGGIEDAVRAMRLGAEDFLVKPFLMEELELKLARALARRAADGRRLSLEEELGTRTLLGDSPALAKVLAELKQAAASHSTVLLGGESGTGKELAARALHQMGPLRNGPFVSVHCAALAAGVLESELFGHERGAFTGALTRRAGRFEMAQGGTLFLDEIGEIPAEIQVKLLRVLQEREFERVGGTRTLKADFRLVAASNRDLARLAGQGRFREDLFYRLSVVRITLPPLRERPEDLEFLADRFARRFCGEQGKPWPGIDPACLPALKAHRWPGNVRELLNLVEQAVVFNQGQPLFLRPGAAGSAGAPDPASTLEQVMERVESDLIRQALQECSGVRNQAAQKLGLSRSGLQYKIQKFALEKYCRGSDEA
jgi:DNA-binding NtrC family response regulator